MYERSRPTRVASASCVSPTVSISFVGLRFFDRVEVFALNVFD